LLYVATVHYKSPAWIEIQTRHLREHISVPFQTWTSLEEIDPSFARHFDRVLESRGPHAGKLNHLALEISHVADENDLLMFLDGDAFPIADPMPLIERCLAQAPLMAVRRAENVDEPQPHPCFCVTTVGTWQSLPGDWSPGATWPEVGGQMVSDVGANLLRALDLTGTPWVQLLRTNGTRLHPLFFGIYAGTVYHHGAAFRSGMLMTRSDRELLHQSRNARRIPLVGPAARRLERRRREAWVRANYDATRKRSEEIREAIARGGREWLAEVETDAPGGPATSLDRTPAPS
jgi:hypothetical protein